MFTCNRCGSETESKRISVFDHTEICQNCKEAERIHPSYTEAFKANLETIRGGDTEFQGIGLPIDL